MCVCLCLCITHTHIHTYICARGNGEDLFRFRFIYIFSHMHDLISSLFLPYSTYACRWDLKKQKERKKENKRKMTAIAAVLLVNFLKLPWHLTRRQFYLNCSASPPQRFLGGWPNQSYGCQPPSLYQWVVRKCLPYWECKNPCNHYVAGNIGIYLLAAILWLSKVFHSASISHTEAETEVQSEQKEKQKCICQRVEMDWGQILEQLEWPV